MHLRMRVFLPVLCLTILLCACKTPKLAERIPGRWQIEHYDEYDAVRNQGSGHALDECGYIEFRKGRVSRVLSNKHPHGALTPLMGAQFSQEDSLYVFRDASGNTLERWLITKDLIDYMEWVRVSEDRDSVFTMYLRK